MTTTYRCRLLFLCLTAASTLCGLADAQTVDAVRPAAKAGFTKPVDVNALDAYRGGNQKVHNEMSLSGTTSDNSAVNVSSGNNAIDAGAFSNMSGIPVVVQNSGSNVLIQNAVILNVKMN